MSCASLKISVAGPGRMTASSSLNSSSSRCLRREGSICCTCTPAGISTPATIPISASQGVRWVALRRARSRRRLAIASAGASASTSQCARSQRWKGSYGRAPAYTSPSIQMTSPGARERSSASRRDLPIPGSPTTSATRPRPPATAFADSTRAPSSCSRPTRGSELGSSAARPAVAEPIPHAATGARLPLTASGGWATAAKLAFPAATSSSPTSSSPSAACSLSRAARLTQSPISEYVRR